MWPVKTADSELHKTLSHYFVTYLSPVSYVCVGELGHHWFRSPVPCEAITWTNADLLSIGLLRVNISVNLELEFYHFHSRKFIWKCRQPKWRQFCPGGDELSVLSPIEVSIYQWFKFIVVHTWQWNCMSTNISTQSTPYFIVVVISNLPISFSSTSLALGEPSDSYSASDATPKKIGKYITQNSLLCVWGKCIQVTSDLRNGIFNLTILIGIFKSSYDNVLRGMPQDLTDDKSTLVQVMAWCLQATSHYLKQCWPRSPTLYGVTRPQWVNMRILLPW